MNPPFATPAFLMRYPQVPSVLDYRPAIDDTATRLVFERTVGTQKAVNLYMLELTIPGTAPQPFVPSLTESTRPPWCRTSAGAAASPGRVAFNNDRGIWLIDGNGSGLDLLAKTAEMAYPSWYPGGAALAVKNDSHGADPNPCSTKIDTAGRVITPVLANSLVFGGMASVNQVNPDLVAFAGQWIATAPHYDQDRNYIWVADASMTPPTVEPLDKRAPVGGPFDPLYQGRAPWWSPDGNWVAFESNRATRDNPAGNYAIFIQDAAGKNPAMQVTDPEWNGQHAKWYPDGVTLVAALFQQPGQGPFGIARLDVGAFVSG